MNTSFKQPKLREQTSQSFSNWLDEFEANQTEAPSYSIKQWSEPESISDQIAKMPNSEKLSPVENWIYKRLPGFSESSVGKALVNFTQWEPAAKVLRVLDVAAEGLERTLGLVAQYRDRDPGETFRLKDAWAAGSLLYDVSRLPRVKYDKDGNATGIQVDNDMPGAYAVTEARRMLEKGATLDEVRDLMYANMGALALRAQIQDGLGHTVADPFNWALGAVKPIQRLHAIRNLALTGKLDVNAVRAMERAAIASGRLEDAAKFAEAIQKAEQSGKAMSRIDKFAIALTGGVPYLQKTDAGYALRDVATLSKTQQTFARLNPFALTPQARASELLDMVAANVGEHLIRPNWTKEPEEFLSQLAGAARGAIGTEWGHVAMTVQGRTVQALLSQSDAAMKKLGQEWTLYRDSRSVLARLASAMPGKDERALWNLARNNPDLLWRQIQDIAQTPAGQGLLADLQRGALTQDTIKELSAIDKSIPLLKEEFYTKALVTIQDVAMRQSILQFGIKEKGVLTKWSDALKAWETLPFIKANPANAIRNLVNNDVTLVGRGLYGTMTGSSIRKFWEGKWVPPAFQRGFGLSGEELSIADTAFDPGNALKSLNEVLEGTGGSLPQRAKAMAEGIDLKAFDFSKFSARIERNASIRAATNGWMEFHQKYWNSRTGFTSISKSIDSATLEQMEDAIPGITEILDDVAAASKGDSAKFAELLQENIEYNTSTILKNTADRLGFKPDDVLGPEVLNRIEEGLPQAIRDGRVSQFVDEVRLEMESHVDDMFAKHVENLPGIIAAQVQAGGPLQYHRVFGKAVDELWGGNIEHAHRMSTINELMAYAKSTGDYKKVGQLWRNIQKDGENHFRRIWSKFDAYQKGLQEGATNAGLKYPQEVADSFTNLRKGWEDFFSFRNKSYDDFFAEGSFTKKSLEQLQQEIDKRFDAMFKQEDTLYQAIDDMMSKQLTDKVQRKMYMNYRDQAAELRVRDRQITADFMKRIRNADPEETQKMWQKYWADKMTRLEQMRALDTKGSAALQGDEASTATFFGGEGGAEAQNVFELASRYDISSTSKKGVRNDRRVLSAINKYSKKTSATDVEIVDNALLPDEVKQAFRQWSEAKQAVKDAQKSTDDLAVRQDAINAAKETEKATRQAYNDALQEFRIDAGSIDKLLKDRTFMNPETVPMRVAQEAFEARKAESVGQSVKAAKEQAFIPDAEKMFPDPMPIETGLSELNYGRSYAAMDAIVEEATATATKKSALINDLPPEIQKKVMQWAERVNTEANSFRAAGVQYAAFRRDSALLNYHRRTNFDNWVGHMAPFAFWTTHSVANWAIHSLDRPAMLTSYFRAREFFETAGLPNQNVPERLKGQIRVNLPFMPDWMSDQFVDPMRYLLPFDGWMMPWEQATSSKFSNESKAQRTLEQMLEKGMITEEQYQQAVNEKEGDIWETAMLQVKEGGDSYDAMDFISMTMTPHAPLMWAYNAAKGDKQDIGPFTPLSRTARNVATMLGVEDWTNSPYNIEGRIRKEMGLPAFDKWEDYRIGRSIANMAADGNYDIEKITQAMEVAALVESGKMDVEEAKRQSEVYKEAIKRTHIETGGTWAGVFGNIIGVPLRAYPSGEQKQRELAEEFSRAYEAYDKGDVDALNTFFEEHPEYESRLALFKSPEERLKTFMVDHIWNRWNELPKIHQDEIKEQLGQNFETYFMDRNTRNYDNLSPQQLNIYLKLMGGKTVGQLSATEEAMVELSQLKLTEPETAWRVDTFYAARKEDYPDWYALQNKYYDLSGKAAQARFRNENPQLVEYWEFRRKWMEQNPDLVRFLTDDEKQIKKYERMNRNPEVAVPTADEIRSNFSPESMELIQEWAGGQNLPPSIRRHMQQLASQYGLTEQQMLGIMGVTP